MVHVPYKGGAPAVAAVLSGETQLVFGSVTTILPHVRANRLRALGVTSAKRSRLLPDVPAIAEAAVPGYELVNWYGIMAPARTPKAIVEKVSADLSAVMQLPDMIDRLTAQGVEPMTSTRLSSRRIFQMGRAHQDADQVGRPHHTLNRRVGRSKRPE